MNLRDLTSQLAGELIAEAERSGFRLRCANPARALAAGQKCGWPEPDVTYAQQLSLTGLTAAEIKGAYDEACAAWNTVCGIRLAPATGTLKNILAKSGKIDGAGGTLAWSYLPCGASMSDTMDQLYDNREAWSFDWLREVITHEVGHAIGLDHIEDPAAIMNPWSNGGKFWRPQAKDIFAVQEIYGAATNPIPGPNPPAAVWKAMLTSPAGELWEGDLTRRPV